MQKFTFKPASFIPFRDTAVIERVRRIRSEDITRHPNKDFRITVMPGSEIEFLWLADMFYRIKTAADAGQPIVMIMPNPWPNYSRLAMMLNKFKVDCRRLYTFNMDEYANERGEIAPETWEFGFAHAFKKYFYANLAPKLRPPEKQIQGPNNKNIKVYGKMIADLGGADICYSGPGWTGHLAFIEPDAPEFAGSLAQWKKMGPRVCTLSPFTIAQNSLHGSFGMSGDLCAVPPKAATIGPAEVIASKHRIAIHAITVDGSFASWQRLTSRLVLHGPVTPRLPESIHQTLRTDVWMSTDIAANIETRWDKGY
jgi:6-phosphogluconolactonase/glucosamine-6-phosphate isomerase/deaminase